MKNSQRGFIVPLLLIVIALLLVGGGAYVYTQMKQPNPSVSGDAALPQATSTMSAASKTTSITQNPISQTADWGTVTMDIGGIVNPPTGSFSFKYPPGWSICRSSPYGVYALVSDNCGSATGDPYPHAHPLNYFEVSDMGDMDRRDLQAGTLKSDTGWETVPIISDGNLQSGMEPMRFVYFPLEPEGLTISLAGSNSAMQSVTDEMARTFTASSSIIAATNSGGVIWKTFINSSKGYALKYPADARIDTSDYSCVQIFTKEFGSVYLSSGSMNPCGEPTGIGVGMIRTDDTIRIAGKQYPAIGYRENDNAYSFDSFSFTRDIFVTYGVSHADKNGNSIGSLTDAEYKKAFDSAKEIVATLTAI